MEESLNTKIYEYDLNSQLISVTIDKGIARAFIKYSAYCKDDNFTILFNENGYQIFSIDSHKLIYDVIITDEEIK